LTKILKSAGIWVENIYIVLAAPLRLLQHTATLCNTLQHIEKITHQVLRNLQVYGVKVICIVLQCVAVCCSVLQ